MPGGSGDTHKSPAECHYVGVHPRGQAGCFPTPRVIGGENSDSVPMHQIAVSGLLGDPEWSPVWGSCRGLRSPTGKLQHARGQRWRYLEGRDWEQQPP